MDKYYTFNEYIKENELTPSEEDYIEMIYRLYIKNNCVKVAELAKNLNVKTPSASKMVKRLHDKKLLVHENYGNLTLSDEGFEIGKSLLLRHNSIEEFLRIIGVENNLHNETEKIEHTISNETLKSIINLVNFFNDEDDIYDFYKSYIKKNPLK